MRILGFSKQWPKLEQPQFTTFRLRRRDKDWEVGEVVQVVLHPRMKQRKVLGIAKIVKKEPRYFACAPRGAEAIGEQEAKEDGFWTLADILSFMLKVHGDRVKNEPLNKLTVEWVRKF